MGEEPSASYIFPAGGQRGTRVGFRVGGHFFHGAAHFEMLGEGVNASSEVREVPTVWFEGPVIGFPTSSRKENYPRDHAGAVDIAADAPLGGRVWRVWTSQGATENRAFVIGDLPEIVEEEISGEPIPVEVELPVTINGRIFPRQDVDLWSFAGKAKQPVTIEVVAARLGSPLDARIEVLDDNREVLLEAIDGEGVDPRVRFVPPEDGRYFVRIVDANFGGLQDYVYRLTLTDRPQVDHVFPLGGRRGSEVALRLHGQYLPPGGAEISIPADAASTFVHRLDLAGGPTNPFTLDVDDLPEHIEVEPNEQPDADSAVAPPAILNGCIATAGDADRWPLKLAQGAQVELDLLAARLGSRLDSVLTVLDQQKEQLARNDDLARGQTDSRLIFKAPQDGVYWIEVVDRFSSRFGPDFAYRLKVRAAEGESDFRLRLVGDARRNQPADMVTVFRDPPSSEGEDKDAKKRRSRRRLRQPRLRIEAERSGGFEDEIEIRAGGLPEGVTFSGEKIGKRRGDTQLTFSAEHAARIGVSRLKLYGVATIDGREVERQVEIPAGDLTPPVDHVLLAVAMPAPFAISSEFNLTYAARGSVFQRRYGIDRGGFDGPLTVRLADRQARHLQGVAGPPVTLPAGATEFTYPVRLPPWMTLGRTSRTCVMLVGTVTDHDGSEHVVSYSSQDQAHQIIAIVKPGHLSIAAVPDTVVLEPGATKKVRLRLNRSKELAGVPVRLELNCPKHVRGITATTIIVPGDKQSAELPLSFAATADVPNLPLTLQATALSDPHPHIAEAKLDVIRIETTSD